LSSVVQNAAAVTRAAITQNIAAAIDQGFQCTDLLSGVIRSVHGQFNEFYTGRFAGALYLSGWYLVGTFAIRSVTNDNADTVIFSLFYIGRGYLRTDPKSGGKLGYIHEKAPDGHQWISA
jgi:hypothetical protein